MINKLDSIKETLAEDEVLLPVGIKDKDGNLQRIAKIKPMTGYTEEKISEPNVVKNSAKLITVLLTDIVESIGTIKNVNDSVIKRLSLADREALIYANRQYSFSDEVNYEDKCPYCNEINTINFNISNLPVEYLEDDAPRNIIMELPIGYTDRDGKVHKELEMTPMNGFVQEKLASLIVGNSSTAMSVAYSMMTKKLGELQVITPDTFKALTKKDRDFIGKRIAGESTGYKSAISTTCASCGTNFESVAPLNEMLGE